MARVIEGKIAKRLHDAFPWGGVAAKGIAKEAREGAEHRRVTDWLRELAEEWEYSEPVGMPDRRMPDAIFRTEVAPFDVFLADAKDAERPTQKKSADQLRGYFEALIELQERGDVGALLFGIGTGDEEAAQAWSDFLVELADENDFDVEAQRHEVGDDDDDRLILVFIELTPPSDEDEDDEDRDGDEEQYEYRMRRARGN